MLISGNETRMTNHIKQLLTRNNIFIFISQFQDKILDYNLNKSGESCKNYNTYYIQSI